MDILNLINLVNFLPLINYLKEKNIISSKPPSCVKRNKEILWKERKVSSQYTWRYLIEDLNDFTIDNPTKEFDFDDLENDNVEPLVDGSLDDLEPVLPVEMSQPVESVEDVERVKIGQHVESVEDVERVKIGQHVESVEHLVKPICDLEPEFFSSAKDVIISEINNYKYSEYVFNGLKKEQRHKDYEKCTSVNLNFAKSGTRYVLFTVLLIGLEILNFSIELIDSLNSKDVFVVNFVKPVILIISYIYAILLMYIFNRNRQKFSIVLTTFWTTLILSSSIILRSKILNYDSQKFTNKEINLFILFITSFILILVNWFVSFFSEYEEKIDPKLYPESNVNLLSWLTFNWINRVIYRGYKKNLSRDDLWNLDEDNSSKALGDELEMEWNKLVAEYQSKRKRKVNSRRKDNSKIYEELELNENFDDTDSKNLRNTKKPSLGFCIFRIQLKNILMASTLVLTHDMLDITGPLILDGLINFVSNEKYPKIIGFFYAGLLFIRLVLLSIFLAHNYNYAFLAGVRTRSSLMNLIYRKSLRLSNESRRKATTGEILNLMQVNTHKFVELSMHGHQVWSGPIKIIAASVLLWYYIGPAVFAGLGVMAILAPLNSIFMTKYSKAETEKLKHQDAKMKILNEILNGIKMIKFYGWEISFEKLINKIRLKELSILRKASIFYGCFNFSFGFISFAVTFASLLTFIYINENNVLTPNVVFVSLSLFNAIRLPLFVFGSAISNLIQTFVSLERIREFLFLEEIDHDQISHNTNLENPIEYKKASFSWSKNSQHSALNNINLIVPKGKLIAIQLIFKTKFS
ncbi:unnamed protein product, partial [Brachionus calyciflorus]